MNSASESRVGLLHSFARRILSIKSSVLSVLPEERSF